MENVELARCYTGPSERVQRLQRLAVEHPDACRASASDVQEALPRVRRESHAGGCVAVVAPASRYQTPAVDPNLGHVFTIGGEHLHSFAAAVSHIHESVIRDFDAVHGWYKLRRPRIFGIKARGQGTLGFLFGCRSSRGLAGQSWRTWRVVHRSVTEGAPHALVRPRFRIEHDDAFVTIAIGNEDFVRPGIDEHIRRPPKARRVRVGLLLGGMTDLHDELAIFRELQDLIVVPVAADPDIPFVVDGYSVLGRGPSIAIPRLPAPALDVGARLIELHHRRPRFHTRLDRSGAMQDPDVAIGVTRRAGHLAQRPPARDVWPRRVHHKLRYLNLGRYTGRGGRSPVRSSYAERPN